MRNIHNQLQETLRELYKSGASQDEILDRALADVECSDKLLAVHALAGKLDIAVTQFNFHEKAMKASLLSSAYILKTYGHPAVIRISASVVRNNEETFKVVAYMIWRYITDFNLGNDLALLTKWTSKDEEYQFAELFSARFKQ